MRRFVALMLALMMSSVSFLCTVPAMADDMDDDLFIDDTDDAYFSDDETWEDESAINAEDEGNTTEVEVPREYIDHITVGSPTAMTGDFFTGLYGRGTSDIDVRELIHGYNLIHWDGMNGMFTIEPTSVADITVMDDDDGDRTYVFELCDDLYYCDGSRVTAWDYAFSFLYSIGIGGVTPEEKWLVGYDAYKQGEIDYLEGVKVLADDKLSIELSHDYLPFFYELGLLSCLPYPISAVTTDMEVKDDGNGVYLTKDGVAKIISTEDIIEDYRKNPTVTTGPYKLISFDGKTAELEANEYYKGTINGVKPQIKRITYTLAEYSNMLERLQKGELDAVNKVTRADIITEGMELTLQGKLAMTNYPRTGYSCLRFETVEDKAVRQAIAWCMDRDAVTQAYTGGYGMRVDGYYGIGQWMYGLVQGTTAAPVNPPENPNDRKAEAEYEAAVKEWDSLSLDNLVEYKVDLEKASALLDTAGWTLNANGLREKNGEVLDLVLAYPEGNHIVNIFNELLVPNLREVGIRLSMVPAAMSDIIHKRTEADITFLGVNFDIIYDPSIFFTNFTEKHKVAADEDDISLYDEAINMRMTEPGDVLSYIKKWVHFQEIFNDELPMIPIYSNIYFDFYTTNLHNYDVAENITWADAIVEAEAYVEEAVVEEAVTE